MFETHMMPRIFSLNLNTCVCRMPGILTHLLKCERSRQRGRRYAQHSSVRIRQHWRPHNFHTDDKDWGSQTLFQMIMGSLRGESKFLPHFGEFILDWKQQALVLSVVTQLYIYIYNEYKWEAKIKGNNWGEHSTERCWRRNHLSITLILTCY